jgi:hypothetical protein
VLIWIYSVDFIIFNNWFLRRSWILLFILV